jgi:hypothetical protein
MATHVVTERTLTGRGACRDNRAKLWRLMTPILVGLTHLAFVTSTALAQSSQVTASPTPSLMDPQSEIALALSACPPNVAPNAAVYTLGATGYVKVRDSQNGFTAIVQHSMPASQEPQCLDAEGARTLLPRILKIAELRAQGRSREEIKLFMGDAIAKGVFQPPTRPGIDYMLSTENIVADDKGGVTHFPPHVMCYAPYLTNSDLGSEGQSGSGPAFVAGEGTPFALIIVPVTPHAGPSHPMTGGSAAATIK